MDNNIKNNISQLNKIAHFQDHLSVRQQAALVRKIGQYPAGLTHLLELLIKRQTEPTKTMSYLDGIIFKYLHKSRNTMLNSKIDEHFCNGIVALESSKDIDYIPLYQSLLSHDFKAANYLTQKHLNTLAGLHDSQKRQWLYFTDISNFPVEDLKTIDALWKIYSEGQFGFSIQKQIWIYSNKNWEKFWHKIGWKINKKNTRYPSEFIWDTSAPIGHLPLFNQLRGVQVLATLFMHPAFMDEEI